MSIFKRGKHAKAEESNTVELSAASIQRIAEGVGPFLTAPGRNEAVTQDFGNEARLYLAPKGTEAPVSVEDETGEGWIEITDHVEPDGFEPDPAQIAAEGEGVYATFTQEDVQNWPEYKEWRYSLNEGVSFSVDEAEETLSFYQVAGSKPVSPFEEELDKVLGEIRALLLEKNASYGDSALNPVRIMSDADAAEQIRIRMDDKLSRLYRGFAFEDTETGNPEDTLKDLVGYYFLLKIAEARNAQS